MRHLRSPRCWNDLYFSTRHIVYVTSVEKKSPGDSRSTSTLRLLPHLPRKRRWPCRRTLPDGNRYLQIHNWSSPLPWTSPSPVTTYDGHTTRSPLCARRAITSAYARIRALLRCRLQPGHLTLNDCSNISRTGHWIRQRPTPHSLLRRFSNPTEPPT